VFGVDRPGLKILFLYALIASVALSALIGIGVILFGNFGEFEIKVLLTTLTVTVTSILGLACGAYLETKQNRLIPVAGIILALVSAVMWVYLIWHGTVHEEGFVKTLMSTTLLSASCSHISLLSLARLDRKFIWSRYAVHVAVWSLTAFLLYLIWNPDRMTEETTGRVVGVLSIIIAALTLVTPILHKLSAGAPESAEIDAEIASLKARIEELEARKASLDHTE
jgi:hypothetical protein